MTGYAKLNKQGLLYRENLACVAPKATKWNSPATPLFTRRQVLAFGAALVPEFAFARALDKRQLSLILARTHVASWCTRRHRNGILPVKLVTITTDTRRVSFSNVRSQKWSALEVLKPTRSDISCDLYC
jgi:hypothetical protein